MSREGDIVALRARAVAAIAVATFVCGALVGAVFASCPAPPDRMAALELAPVYAEPAICDEERFEKLCWMATHGPDGGSR